MFAIVHTTAAFQKGGAPLGGSATEPAGNVPERSAQKEGPADVGLPGRMWLLNRPFCVLQELVLQTHVKGAAGRIRIDRVVARLPVGVGAIALVRERRICI